MNWTRGHTIGRGSSSRVSLATTTTGHLFAVKSADVSSSRLLQNEQYLISQLCSPFIIKCLGSDITSENNQSLCNIFLEYVSGGTLSDLVRNHGGSLPETAIQFYTHQLLKGLNYLHANGIVHCDIKGQNILIGNDGLKIADFGCAKKVECGGSAAFAGTPAFMAPEVARGEEQSFPVDIWALGCTVIEMATGSNPWPEMKDPAAALYRVAYSDDTLEIPSWFSGTGKDFVARCLIKDPRERWTAEELLHHPFFDSTDFTELEIKKHIRESPTSVMDQCFWDAVEASPDATENAPEWVDRIRGLIGEDDGVEWTEEEDWMTVRINEIEEVEEIEDTLFNSLMIQDFGSIHFSSSQGIVDHVGSQINDSVLQSTIVTSQTISINNLFIYNSIPNSLNKHIYKTFMFTFWLVFASIKFFILLHRSIFNIFYILQHSIKITPFIWNASNIT